MTAQIMRLLPPSARADALLELEIRFVTLRLQRSIDPRVRRVLADAQRQLVALRSPAQVARMEAEKGLN
jgi:hypothetical protein